MINSYFKKKDIVKLKEIWRDALFEIESFHGNEYLPLATVIFLNKTRCNKNRCNFDIRFTTLINSEKRPLRNLDKKILAKLYVKGNIEAKREFLIRKNNR